MQQLVNSKCVLCQQRIGSIVEGSFCKGCGGPVHKRCIRPETAATSEDRCAFCGSDRPEIVVPSHKAKPTVDAPRRKRRLLFVVIAVAVAIVSSVCYFWLIPTLRYASNASKPPQTVSAEQLRKEMRENPNEALSTYAPGIPLILTGVVIGEGPIFMPGFSGDYDVTLTGRDDNPGEAPWIMCRVREDQIPAFRPVHIDDVITVQGNCLLTRNDFLVLHNCTLSQHPGRPKQK